MFNVYATETYPVLIDGFYDDRDVEKFGYNRNVTYDSSITRIVTVPPDCSQCNGKISLDLTGVLPPFTITWSGTGTDQRSMCPGVYGVTVLDANGCEWHKHIPVYPIADLLVMLNRINVTCLGMNNGSVMVGGINGIPPFVFAWSNGAATPSLQQLYAGTYMVTVTDVNGCSGSASIAVTEPPLLAVIIRWSMHARARVPGLQSPT